MSIHPNAPPRASKPDIDDPEEYLEMLLKREPRPKRRDTEKDVLKRFSWWNRWKPWWRPDGFASSKPEEKVKEGPWSRTSAEQRAHQQHRDDAEFRQKRERVEQERARQKQKEKNTGSKMTSNGIDGLFANGDRAVLEWTLSSTDYSPFRYEDHHTESDIIQILFAAMTAVQQDRDRAIEVINLLIQERKELRSYVAAQSRSDRQTDEGRRSDHLYRRVGLNEKCPNFVLMAARTAYRKKLHPDMHPQARKAEAERRFQEMEAVFDEIERQRDCAGRG